MGPMLTLVWSDRSPVCTAVQLRYRNVGCYWRLASLRTLSGQMRGGL